MRIGRGDSTPATADKELVREPVYDVKSLDEAVTRIAREIRLLEQAMRRPTPGLRSRATTKMMVLGEVI
jgi:hypothetical protein